MKFSIKDTYINFSTIIISTLITAGFLLTSCGEQQPRQTPPVTKPTGRVAYANLKPTEGNNVTGTVEFIELEEGVKVIGRVQGLQQGEHGFHIHEFGDCSAPDGTSAGGHYNPGNEPHGGPDDVPRHAGDLGNITADKDGNGDYERIDYIIKLQGPDSIIGKSVIVHMNNDDFISQPTGNAGARVACGVIVEGEAENP